MDDQAVPVVSYARISVDTASDEHGVADPGAVKLFGVECDEGVAGCGVP